MAAPAGSSSHRKRRPCLTALAFLSPNLIGFAIFTLGPILLSLLMVFTNWNLKPAVRFEIVGFRNLLDLVGMAASAQPRPYLASAYVLSVVTLLIGFGGLLWANITNWRGLRTGGVLLLPAGLVALVLALATRGFDGVAIGGALAAMVGLAMLRREDGDWRLGRAVVPVLLWIAGAVGLWILHRSVWTAYAPSDARFWSYFYNTLYLMLAIPFAIAGSLVLALLLNERLSTAAKARRFANAGICLLGAIVTLGVFWMAGWQNLGVLAAVAWLLAALALAFDIIAFRTIFYLPTFTAGVALMILWKALYNPEIGPINVALRAIFHGLGLNLQPPNWLTSVTWAKPAIMLMGIWTAVGGMNMLLYLAGLSNVPRDLLDAAEVDGAGRWNRFRHVLWPQLAPTTFFICITSIIGGMQGGFEQARVMTNGGPAGATTTLSFYIYTKAFQELDLGYAAAIAWVLFGIIFIATALNWRFGRELEVSV